MATPHPASKKAGSRVCFVGNIPYNVSEEQLISIFSEVGPVAGFRLVFDRDTGKPKGYGFCEFFDPETAASAVRNLNDVDVGGRNLRIDWADVDPVFQGKTTQNGQIEGELPKREGRRPGAPAGPQQGGFGGGMGPGAGGPPPPLGMGGEGPPQFNTSNLPQGAPLQPGVSATDAITQTLATLPPNQLLDIMGQIKSLILTSPQSAQALLTSHPQLTYALFQAMLMMNLVDPAILQRILAGSGALTAGGPSQQQQQPPQQQQGRYPGAPPQPPGSAPAPPPGQYGGGAGGYGQPGPPPSRPPQGMPYQQQQQQQQQGRGYTNTPPPGRPGPPYQGQGQNAYSGNQNAPQQQYMTPPPGQQPQQQQLQPQQAQLQQPHLQHQQPQTAVGGLAAAAAGGAGGNLEDSQRQLLMQVLSLTDAQIAALPADQRDSIMLLRKQYGK